MIKCNVTIVGRVFRAPEIKNDREGNPFVTFGVSTELKNNGETRDIDISVACDGVPLLTLDYAKSLGEVAVVCNNITITWISIVIASSKSGATFSCCRDSRRGKHAIVNVDRRTD